MFESIQKVFYAFWEAPFADEKMINVEDQDSYFEAIVPFFWVVEVFVKESPEYR